MDHIKRKKETNFIYEICFPLCESLSHRASKKKKSMKVEKDLKKCSSVQNDEYNIQNIIVMTNIR